MPNIPQGELPKPKSWDEFEDICWDLYTRLWEDAYADRYGSSGEPQHGVDILGHPKHLDGKCAGVQCKRYEVGKLTRAKIRREILEADKFTPTLAEYIIATTDARTAGIQSFVEQTSQDRVDAGKFPVYIAFWDTLCGLLTNPEYEDILLKHYGDWVALALRAASPTATALVRRLPADLADFAGRQAQIQRVRDLLEQQRIVAINGMGGIGKTALAVHVASQLITEGSFSDAQLYIDLKGTDPTPVDPVDALGSLLNSIQKPDPDEPAPKRRRDLESLKALWQEAIAGKAALLILDNAAGATQVGPLLPGCPTCAVIVTSRHRFNLDGAPRRLDLRPMEPGEARDLLQELAPRLDAAGADQIAELCGRLPQALRVAGNYLNLNDNVTPDRYAAMLTDERTRLAQLRDPDDPDLDVFVTISLSVAQLDDDSRRAWALLSLFPAPFDLPAAAALWDQPEDQSLTQLTGLRNRSLITYDLEAARYHQHDLVRLAAAGELQALPQWESYAAHLRYASHYEQVARTANDLYREGGENAFQALALFDLEWPHIRAGQAWAAAHAEDDDGAACLCSDYAVAASYLLLLRRDPRDRVAWLEPALRCARRLGGSWAEVAHLNDLGIAYTDMGDWDRAIKFYEQALEAAGQQVGTDHRMARTYINLGLVYYHKGDWDRAIKLFEQTLETFEQVDDIRGRAETYNRLGLVYARKGEQDRAIELYRQALQTYEQVGDKHRMALTYGNLASVHFNLEEMPKAQSYCMQQLTIAQQLGDPKGQARALWGLARVHSHFGEMQQAREKYKESLALLGSIGDPAAESVRRLLAELDD